MQTRNLKSFQRTELFELGLDGFERSIEDEALFDGYGRLLFLCYYVGSMKDNNIVPFLREYLKKYPNMLIYCNAENAEGGTSIYNRDQLNAFPSNNV